MKNKEKKKGKKKSAGKQKKRDKIKAARGTKPGKIKESTKALRKEILRLTRELQARDDQLNDLRGGHSEMAPVIETTPVNELDELAQSLHESSNAGSISERKKIWERHQYLRTRYEKHLEAGLAKAAARRNADRDLRQRYGDGAGYTEEQLDSILS